jgi:glycosyltransferase involved in cell wall biosynthesis
MPWTTQGVFKNFDQQRFNTDPGYQRFVAYGNTAVEEFVVNNKLDVVLAVEDVWAFEGGAYLNSEWFKHIKQNTVLWSTADSEPILPNFKEWAEKCPNVWFWSSFAERCLREENKDKYGHCKTLHGSINSKLWFPLPQNQRLALRKSFGIQDDEKIIIYLGRNQLRKLFWSHMEALKKWKQKFPNKKLRLLFHCSWDEGGMGWPLDRIRDELKLSKEDVLSTYYCKTCGFWNVQPFEGQDLDCPVCQGKKTRLTAGVGSTITEEDLNKIYNLADGSASIFTSGGFEYTHAESLLAGVPLASVDYSCGEDFCKNDFVYTIQGTFTRETGTSFKKFVPNIDSIVNFYDHIYNMSPEKKNKVVLKGRQWAIENFDASIITQKIENFIDTCKPIDWDVYFNRKKELKDPNAPIEDIQDDFEFVCTAYERILKMMDMRDRNKPETAHWLNFLTQPKDKNQLKNELINTFRQIAAQKNQEVQKLTLADLLIKNDKKHLLLVAKESGGDIFHVSATLDSLRQSYPKENWNIYLACDKQYFDLLDLNPNIDKILEYNPSMENEINMTGMGGNKGTFDAYIHSTILCQRQLSYLTNNNLSLQLQ